MHLSTKSMFKTAKNYIQFFLPLLADITLSQPNPTAANRHVSEK